MKKYLSPLYRIKDWNRYFEINRTRELKHARWVPVPNKHDGEGYTDLITRPDGGALFGGWNLLIQVASKCEPRGTLIKKEGEPHDPASLSWKTRAPRELFEKCIPILLEIGWLEIAKHCPVETSMQIPQEGAGESQEGALQTDRTGTTLQTEQAEENSVLPVGGREEKVKYLTTSGISKNLLREGNGIALQDKILSFPLDQIKACWEQAQKADKDGTLKKPPLALFQSLLKQGFMPPPVISSDNEKIKWPCPFCKHKARPEMKGCPLCGGTGNVYMTNEEYAALPKEQPTDEENIPF